jgi:hypothetical protein
MTATAKMETQSVLTGLDTPTISWYPTTGTIVTAWLV